MSVTFFSEGIDFNPDNLQQIRKWLSNVISDKGFSEGTINYIFCNDDYLLNLNKQYLNHDTYTDVITFDYHRGNVVSGDIFISVDRVSENAYKFKETFESELNRVIVHGVLHLCGIKDKTHEESQKMRIEEQFYLQLLASK